MEVRLGTADVVTGLMAVLSNKYREMYPEDLVGIKSTDLFEGLQFLKFHRGHNYLAIDYRSMDGIINAGGFETLFPGRMIMSPRQSRGCLALIEGDYPNIDVREMLEKMAEEYIQYFKDKEEKGFGAFL